MLKTLSKEQSPQEARKFQVRDMIETAATSAEQVRMGAIPVSVANSVARNLESGIELMKAEIYRERIALQKNDPVPELGTTLI